MKTRLASNTNLTLHSEPYFQGKPVQVNHGDLIHSYLVRIDQVIRNALSNYPRTLVIRIDLRLPQRTNDPDSPCEYDNQVITRFIASLKAQLNAAQAKKYKEKKRIYPCILRYVWCCERDTSANNHYHLALFFNRDAYNYLGVITATEGNLAARIKKAWASALNLELWQADPLVHFNNQGVFRLDVNSPSYVADYKNLFFALSYFTKAYSKHYGDGSNSFGYSKR